MRLSSHVDPRRRIGRNPCLDLLEDRTLLSTVGGSKFAVYQGRLVLAPADSYTLVVDRFGFRPGAGNRVLLKVDTQSTDASFDPAAAETASSNPRGVQTISSHDDVSGGTGSSTIVSVGPGALTIQPTAQNGTTGGYDVNVSLAGDVNGDFKVDRTDLAAIRSAIGVNGPADTVLAGTDVDGDGVTTLRDWRLAFRNLGASTSYRPRELTAGVAPADDPNGDNTVDADVSKTSLVGKAAPGSIVKLGAGTSAVTTTAGADGSFHFDVDLALGVNTFDLRATSPDGQVVMKSVSVVRGSTASVVTESYDFSQGAQGWDAGFADIPTNPNDTYELDSGIRDLPADLNTDGTGYLLQSHNRSDDAFMFLTRKLTAADGVVAGATYSVEFTIKFASNAPSNAAGIGGAPGESVVLKAGASTIEPEAVVDGDMLRMNIDKGNNSTGGRDASVVGNIANGQELEGDQTSVPYVSLTREHTHTATVQADAQGNLWLIVGTDSGYEGLTAIYFQSIAVTLTPVALA
ncbi:dockerin type I domain-containing protein [Paludisphaera rhizosphaerae]|uniref:dockerin type I domain-containing protein n=1 Tax=Paludisphaera rhizosphaerae TaxID=2711216 RepID=UPI0013EBC9CA|nr:dockerin type I domain-containing protein [Paludisphaera rhizosphaerae]